MENKHNNKYLIVGRNICNQRKEKGLTQQQLADIVGVSKSYISKIEAPNCEKSFSLEVLFDISEALNIPISLLFKDV